MRNKKSSGPGGLYIALFLTTRNVLTGCLAQDFRATYKADFQYYQGNNCNGPYPRLYAYCKGESLTVTSTTDPTIQCTAVASDNDEFQSAVECINTCATVQACRQVWFNSGIRQGIGNAPFGSIVFECTAANNEPEAVEGAFRYSDSGQGSCQEDCCYSDNNHSWHVARLGVQCPDNPEADAQGFIYDPNFFECSGDNLYPFIDYNLDYICATGDNCGRAACNLDYGELWVHAEPFSFEDCIQALVDDGSVPDILPPGPVARPAGSYSARFQANWQTATYRSGGNAGSGGCSEESTGIITCSNGAVTLLATDSESTVCRLVSAGMLECTDSLTDSRLASVTYECMSQDSIPTTSFQYLANDVLCVNRITAQGAFRAVQLGVACGGSFVFAWDFVDCGQGTQVIFDSFEGVRRYACHYRENFPTSNNFVFGFPNMEIYTDYLWQNEADASCYAFVPDASATLSPTPSNQTQPDGSNFIASYKADFQFWVGGNCVGPVPLLRAHCKGVMLRVVQTSDASIQCQIIDTFIDGYRSSVECTNTCSGNDCPWIQRGLSSNGMSIVRFGSIYFDCEGDQVEDVEGSFTFVDSGSGSCAFDDSGTDLSQNFHITRLGVLCPAVFPNPAAYNYDSAYFECSGKDVYPLSERRLDYVCAAGWDYFGEAGVVDYGDLTVHAELWNFRQCISSPRGLPIPEIPPPSVAPRLPGTYVSRFQANWLSGAAGERRISPTNRDCTEDSNVRIICTNGIIKLVNTVYDSVRCTAVDDSTLECTDQLNSSGNRTGVEYTCASVNQVATTDVDYLPGEVSCSSNSINSYGAFRNIQLGVFCNTSRASQFLYTDQWNECSEKSNVEFFRGDDNSQFSARFTCGQYKTFFGDAFTQLDFDLLRIQTDHRWQNDAAEDCFLFTASNEVLPPTAAPSIEVLSPTSVATVAPGDEVSSPTAGPMAGLGNEVPSPTAGPTADPTADPMTAPENEVPSLKAVPTALPTPGPSVSFMENPTSGPSAIFMDGTTSGPIMVPTDKTLNGPRPTPLPTSSTLGLAWDVLVILALVVGALVVLA